MSSSLRLGLIGLDTSHAPAFAKLLNDASQEHHVPGGRITTAFPGGSPDFALSRDRVEGFTAQVCEYDVQLAASTAEVAENSDAILLTSVDGRVHLEQFRAIAPFGKPVFLDKPFATNSEDARAIVALAEEHNVPLMSCSSLRYAVPLTEALAQAEPLIGADCCGPMAIEPTQGRFFWYGIHSVEMLYAAFGVGCESVSTVSNDDYDLITARWKDGRIGTVRGNRKGNSTFGALLHTASSSQWVNAYKHPKPAYAPMLEAILGFFQTGQPPIAAQETLEIIRFLEAAYQSLENQSTVIL
jgi:predicted dehydrogenase